MPKSTCTIEGCTRSLKGRGLCDPHYKRAWRSGELEVTRWASDAERFWAKVDKAGDCWEWTGQLRPESYGKFSLGGRAGKRMVHAHRFAYELEVGPIPSGEVIDHLCFNRICVRPDHLRAITQKQNCEHLTGPKKSNKTSGVRGVIKTPGGRWLVRVKHNYVPFYIGTYDTLDEAEAAAIQARARIFTHDDAHTWNNKETPDA